MNTPYPFFLPAVPWIRCGVSLVNHFVIIVGDIMAQEVFYLRNRVCGANPLA